MHKIMSETGIDCLRVLLRLQNVFIDPDQLLPAPRVFTEYIIGNSIEPRRETSFPAETANMFIGLEKSLLREVIGESRVGSSKLAQQAAYGRLVPTDQLAESVLVFIDKDSSDKVGIG